MRCEESGFSHRSVMVTEVLDGLRVGPGGRWFDGTSGGGGHGEAILRVSSPDGFLWACDQDADAVEASQRRLEPFAGRVVIRRMNFGALHEWTEVDRLDGALLDLGVSSHQIDTASRGFSFQQEGPLDMRMDRTMSLTAAEVVNTWPEEELARIFWRHGDERHSRGVARAIVRERVARAFETTGQLASTVARVVRGRNQRIHPATRVFQALRIVVNREWEVLSAGLGKVFDRLRSGGRLAVLTFHSGEDRLVKDFQRSMTRDYTVPGDVDLPELRMPREPLGRWVTRKPLEASEEECRNNPRSRSARLRLLEKV